MTKKFAVRSIKECAFSVLEALGDPDQKQTIHGKHLVLRDLLNFKELLAEIVGQQASELMTQHKRLQEMVCASACRYPVEGVCPWC